jgi:DNA-binding SARP family transcriptional activator
MQSVPLITTLQADQLHSKVESAKVILTLPWTHRQSAYLAPLLELYGDRLLYHRLRETDLSLSAVLGNLLDELQVGLPRFGAQTRAALKGGKGPKLGESLAADLAELKGKYMVYLDEFDRLPMDSNVDKFLRTLVANLPANVTLTVNSRRLTHQPWYSFVKEGIAVVVGSEFAKDDGVFMVEKENRPRLEVYAFGRGYAVVNGFVVDNWDGALPRNLFFYFMDNTLVTRSQIFQMFWPELPVKEATNVFHVTKRKIAERLSMKVNDGQNYELTRYANGFYTPSEKLGRHYDVADFQSAVERALMTGDKAEEETLLRQAVELYRGPFLSEIDMEWIVARRDSLRQMYAQALIGLGRLTRRRDDLAEALGYFTRALAEVPEREDIHREVMNIYIKLGRNEDARRQYNLLADMLRTQLKISPSKETQELLKLMGD